jgi:ABC-2 type transport system ATP-binding protein
MPDAVLCLDKLTVRYADFVAVDGLDLELNSGELFGLLGPNGAGKSTTLRVLIGQRRPHSGRVTLAGLDVVRQWHQVKPLFGYVPDRENHFEEFSGLSNLLFFAELYGVDRRRVDECLAMVELSEAAKLPVKAYSLGMRRKLLLARALLHRPRILYLDEPSANLDVHSIEVVHRILKGLTASGMTVLMTTHNMPEVEQVCDRVAILCKGRLVALDSPLALRMRHAERLVDVTLDDGSKSAYDLEDEAQRARLNAAVSSGRVASMRTREFDFHQAFLKLTGMRFE